jgi:hypothetical protein
MQVGTKLYAFNFVNGSAAGGGAGGQNTLLCFDLTTVAACAGQPIIVNVGVGIVSAGSFPTPASAAIGTEIVIPIVTGGSPLLACYDAATAAACAGSWPAAAPGGYPGSAGPPFAELDPTGKLIGLCLPTGTDQCYSLMGASVATPPGMTAAIGGGSVSWDGTGLVLGPRVYVPAWTNVVYCYDSSTSASCSNFPKFFSNLGLLYTVNPDPQRPTCIWVNSDNGADQIQNFDAYSGGACGSGPIRVLASSLVVPTQLCTPFTYTSLQVLAPAPSSYTSGTVAFEDPDGNPIAGSPVLTLDATGTASLTGLSLNTSLGLPEFLITLTGASTRPTSVTVQLTWTGVTDPSCTPAGGLPQITITNVIPGNSSVQVYFTTLSRRYSYSAVAAGGPGWQQPRPRPLSRRDDCIDASVRSAWLGNQLTRQGGRSCRGLSSSVFDNRHAVHGKHCRASRVLEPLGAAVWDSSGGTCKATLCRDFARWHRRVEARIHQRPVRPE